MEASWAANIAENELMETRLLGTKGGLVQRNLNGGYDFEAEIFTDKNGKLVQRKLQPEQGDWGGPMQHFIDCIIKGKPHTATGEQGLVVMELLDALYKSAATGKPVKI